MSERPILFSGPMVRAILEGRKTQTRRVVKGIALDWLRPDGFTPEFTASPENSLCPYGNPGDTLWVRETWGPFEGGFIYRADEGPNVKPDDGRWHPSIHMPRDASRLSLLIKSVRVERLQEISEADAFAEGVGHYVDSGAAGEATPDGARTAREWFAQLWDTINAKSHPWASNPWVWVVEFEKINKEKNNA